MAKLFATTNPYISEREVEHQNLVRRLAPEGVVLLENNGILPFNKKYEKIALYGSGARRTIKGGTGSGDVNTRENISIEEGLIKAGITLTTGEWMDQYDQMCDANLQVHMGKIAEVLQKEGEAGIAKLLEIPYKEPEEPEINESNQVEDRPELAVYVIARNSGEGKDREVLPGDYELSEREISNMRYLREHYEKFVIVLNVGGVIDTKFLRKESGADAILLMSQAGNIGGYVFADILTGKSYPSGRLTQTWAENYEDYPSSNTFSYRNQDLDDEYYEEGIFVGYRYFDSFGLKPAYPFGYGKSYTEFTIQNSSIHLTNQSVSVTTTVTNVGNYVGKEVLQLYVSANTRNNKRPYQDLMAFAKTKELIPEETEKIEISFPVEMLKTYDEVHSQYVIEAGEYLLRLGVNAKDTEVIGILRVDEMKVLSQHKQILAEEGDIGELKVDIQHETEPDKMVINLLLPQSSIKQMTYSNEKQHVFAKTNHNYTLAQVKSGTITIDEFVSDLSEVEMALLCVGAARGGFGSTSVIGAASTLCPGAAGDTTSELNDSRGVGNVILADGPAGLRLSKHFVTDQNDQMIPGLGESAVGGLEALFGITPPERPEDAKDYYQYCTAIPIATMLAQTWNENLIEQIGDMIGQEMEEFGVDIWLAPGMNIQRNPLCGRNFEYYSEDPLISGKCAAAETRGVQKHSGKGVTIKHFALNNQEDNRSHNNAHCSERTIRELYLRGFEIAVKESNPMAIMSSYNLLNGVHTANSYGLLTEICRNEWGYDGMIMTDWGTTGGGDINPNYQGKYGFSSAVECMRAGNNLIMPGSQADLDEIISAINDGNLGRNELARCAKRVINIVLKTEVER